MAGNCHPHTVKNPFRPAIHWYIPLNLHDISVELINKNILRLPRCDDPNLRHLGEHMYRMIPASCGSTPAKANLQSLLLEKLSLENLDWLSSFETFINDLLRALTAWLHVAQGWRSRRPRKKQPMTLCTGFVPAPRTRTPPVISQFFLPTAYNHPPWTCPAPWMYSIVTFTSTMPTPAFSQECNRGTKSSFFLSRRAGTPGKPHLI